MKIRVIGAVAAGTSAAAKARRNNDEAEIIIYEMDEDISYSGCGIPYYIGGKIERWEDLTPRDSAFFKKKYNIDVVTRHQVLSIDIKNQRLTVKNLATDEIFDDQYDKLVISTGAIPVMPPIEGRRKEHVFSVRNINDARKIKKYLCDHKVKTAVVVGSGFIGLEMVENLIEQGISVTLVEREDTLTPMLDNDMAKYLKTLLKHDMLKIVTGQEVVEISDDHVRTRNENNIKSDIVVIATGVRPNVKLASQAGIVLGETGAIKVNEAMMTNVDNVFACGDCIETYSSITGKAVYHPLGSTANKTGRIAGDVLSGGNLRYQGNLSTGIFKIFDFTVASTGLTEEKAIEEGYEIIVNHNIKPDRPSYYDGAEMCIKTIVDVKTKKILGVQIIGKHGVDKRIDVFVTLITLGASIDQLFHLDLAYAPPFSTTKDPVHYTGMILENALENHRPLITEKQLRKIDADTIQIVDARIEKQYEDAHVDFAKNFPHARIRERLDELDPNITTVTYCNKGTTGNAVQNILINRGFKKVFNLSGGHKFYKSSK